MNLGYIENHFVYPKIQKSGVFVHSKFLWSLILFSTEMITYLQVVQPNISFRLNALFHKLKSVISPELDVDRRITKSIGTID